MSSPQESRKSPVPTPEALRGRRIAFVHDWLVGFRGGEKCLDLLCRRFPDARVFTLLHRRGSTSPAIERMPITTSWLNRLPGVSKYYRTLAPLMPGAIESLTIPRDVELVVSLSHAFAKGVRVPSGVPHVCYCFTPMRYAWERRSDYVSRGLLAPLKNKLLDRLRRWDLANSQGVTKFVAISDTIAGRLKNSYGVESSVVYPPVDVDYYTPEKIAREDFYLCVSALVPYKRLDLAVEACNRLKRRLIVIGDGPERARLARLAGPTVQVVGWRRDEEIRDHLRRCRAFLFPGVEDFGIAPVEAQACGAPVIAIRAGGATETVLEGFPGWRGSGVFFEQQTAESIIEAMERFEATPELCDARVSRANAEDFAAEHYERGLLEQLAAVMTRLQGSALSDPAISERRAA